MKILSMIHPRRWDKPICYKNLRLEYPFCTLAALFFLLGRDSAGLIRLSFGAALLHESGHLLVYRRLQGRWPALKVTLTGFSLAAGALSRKNDFWVTLAGPLANLLAFGACWGAAQYKAGYSLYFFAAANFCMGVFNLLPVPPLDGRRLWELVRD